MYWSVLLYYFVRKELFCILGSQSFSHANCMRPRVQSSELNVPAPQQKGNTPCEFRSSGVLRFCPLRMEARCVLYGKLGVLGNASGSRGCWVDVGWEVLCFWAPRLKSREMSFWSTFRSWMQLPMKLRVLFCMLMWNHFKIISAL